MTEFFNISDGRIAFDLAGTGPLIVLAHGIGDRRQAFRFLVPELVRAGFRVAAADMRGHGESSTGDWKSITRTDVADDLVGLVRHLGGGPAVIVGHSLSRGGHHRRRDRARPGQRHRRDRPVHPPADVQPGRAAAELALPSRHGVDDRRAAAAQPE